MCVCGNPRNASKSSWGDLSRLKWVFILRLELCQIGEVGGAGEYYKSPPLWWATHLHLSDKLQTLRNIIFHSISLPNGKCLQEKKEEIFKFIKNKNNLMNHCVLIPQNHFKFPVFISVFIPYFHWKISIRFTYT